MSLFSEVKPQWDNVGTDPGGTKKQPGGLRTRSLQLNGSIGYLIETISV